MTVAELITELQKLPQDLTVMAAGETAQKVIIEECRGNRYVRIFEPWDVEFVGREIKATHAARVPFNKMFSWDEFCPEYYCSNCKRQIATNKEDAKKLSSCPYCHLEFEEEE